MKTACRITLAVAGFTSDDLAIELVENQLSVRGKQTDDTDRVYLHRGIAARQFQRAFMLADGIEVTGGQLDNGLLSIDLVRPQAEPRIRTIHIDSGKEKQGGQDDRHYRAPHRLALNAAKEVAMENERDYDCLHPPRGRRVPEPRHTADRLHQGGRPARRRARGRHLLRRRPADGGRALVEIAQALIRQHELEPALVH